MVEARRKKDMKKVSLAAVKDQLSKFLHDAEREEIVITRHGKPAGVLIGFESEDDWFDYKLENDPRFLSRVGRARASLRRGRGIPLEDIPTTKSTKRVPPNPRTARKRSAASEGD
jgi:prevent-host-death family protein